MIPHSRQDDDPKPDLDRLEAALKELKVEFEKFFNGAVRIPPESLKTSIEARFRRLRSRRLRLFADRFRLNGLEARFNSLNEMFNRRLREIEHGARSSEGHVKDKPPALDPFAGLELQGRNDSEAAELLYQELYRSSGRSRKVDFDTFQQFLGKQIESVQKKTGCSRVRMWVSGEGDELKLRAKPIRDETCREVKSP
jgi:hypothetical protein